MKSHPKKWKHYLNSVGNSHQSGSPRRATLEEDQKHFVDFFSIIRLWFEMQGMRTYKSVWLSFKLCTLKWHWFYYIKFITLFDTMFHHTSTYLTSADSNIPPTMSPAPSIIGLEQHLWYLQPDRLESVEPGALNLSVKVFIQTQCHWMSRLAMSEGWIHKMLLGESLV